MSISRNVTAAVAAFVLGALTFVATDSDAAPVNFGNSVEFAGAPDVLPFYLLGSAIDLPDSSKLLSAGIIFKSSGYKGNVGIYSDTGGSPDQLIATTGVFSVGATGDTQIGFLTNPTVSAGSYWFMAIFDGRASIGRDDSGPVTNFAYKSLKFPTTLPMNFGSGLTFDGGALNYYIVADVQATSPVPLPPAMGMLAGALAILGFLARRRKVAAA